MLSILGTKKSRGRGCEVCDVFAMLGGMVDFSDKVTFEQILEHAEGIT